LSFIFELFGALPALIFPYALVMKSLPAKARIYIRIPNWVGDVVMAEPFLKVMRKGFPDAQIDVHGRPHLFPFIRSGGYYDHEIPLERGRGPLWPIKEGLRLRRQRPLYDLAVVLPNSLSSAMIICAMGASRRIGYRLNGRFFFLTKVLGVRKKGKLRPIPMVSYYLQLAQAVGLDVSAVVHCPSLPVTEEALDYARQLFKAQAISADDEVWAINMGGAWVTKQWKINHAIELTKQILAAGHQVLILGGPGEEDFGRQIREAVKKKGIFGLPEFIVPLDKLVAVLGRCRILVSTDSGPRHFGVASGIPVVALIGPTHPAYTGVDYEAMSLVCEQLSCWPCHLRSCPLEGAEHHKCMTALTGHRVFKACEALLEKHG
jgi:heptosyltransferase II